MLVTRDQLSDFFNTELNYIDKFVDPINRVILKYSIDSNLRLSMYMAQIAHESLNLKNLSENLNYSSSRLLEVFPKYFDAKTAAEYARKPELIANRVYANRMGNGPEESGDGYKYRGRGAIQLTGKSNYKLMRQDLAVDTINNPDWVTTPEGAILSSGWFWNKNTLNRWADKGDVETTTRKINGGTNGLASRKKLYRKALHIFI